MKRIVCLLALVFLVWGCSSKRGNELVVGMDLSYPPFEMIGPDGQPAGISVELAKGLANYVGKELKIENIPFTGLIPSLQNGRVDCVISSMTDTAERRKTLDFSKPYLTIGLAMLVSNKDKTINNLIDLDRSGRTIVVRQGTTGEVWARSNIRKATILAVDKENSAVLEVVQGKADAFIYDQMSIWQNWQKNQDTTRALLAPLTEEFWAVGLKKGNEKLREQVDTFFGKFRGEGGFDRLRDQYLQEQQKAFKEQGQSFYF